jgi:hypothetical protein
MNDLSWLARSHMAYPDTLAQVASQGNWIPFRHLSYLSETITPLIIKGGARVIIEMPPRVGKSMFVTEWLPIWFLQNFPRKNVIISAYSHELATDFGRKIRNQLQFNSALPVRLAVDSQAADRFRTTANGEVYAQGIGGSLTGRGAHLFIVDDPFKDWKEASSEAMRKDRKNWWDSTAETRLEPGASVVVVNTRWHQDDLAGHLQSLGNWLTLSLPALCTNPEKDPLGRKLGESLCPERYDEKYYADKKFNSAPMIWNALYQQQPTPAGGTIIQREWLRYYDKPPEKFDRLIQSWDLTFKDSENSDYVVGQVWGYSDKNYYLLHQVRDRLSFTATLQKMLFV